MTDFASFAGERVISVHVSVPLYGLWSADAVLATSADIPADASPLVIGDLSLIGDVFRAANFAGSRSARIVGGNGGWRQLLPKQEYRGTNVRLSVVLGDAATAVGERVSIDVADANLERFTRETAPASRVLRQVAGDLWWVSPDGVTHVGPRVAGTITTDFEVIGWSGKTGAFTIATEHVSDWMPGRSFTAPTVSGTQTIGYTGITMTNDGRLRLEVLSL